MIRVAMLGSGSRGNATLVQCGSTTVMVDCGFFLREAEQRLGRWGVLADQLSAILVTHEHADHLGGVARLARKHHIPVYMTHGTFAAWDDPLVPRVHRFPPEQSFRIGELDVQPFPVPHDAREPAHFVFSDGTRRVGVISDAGSVTAHMRAALSGLDALLLEFNHDVGMLARGPYPPPLKARVGGHLGHLSNIQSAALLREIDCTRLQHLALTHISEKNNTPDLALAAAREGLGQAPDWLVCAHQNEGLPWKDVA
jgi:phosphoribosyl 1,2-cyclic phosphodiesterase